MDAGEERIEEAELIEALRRKARWINRRAMITAVIATLLALLFP